VLDERKELLKHEIVDYSVNVDSDICSILNWFSESHGFTASQIVDASKILYDMVSNNEVTRILSFTGNIISTGLRGVITQLIRSGFFHIVITTCGAIDHDIARSMGGKYYRGVWYTDDRKLRELGIHRLGNVFIPIENYGLIIESFVRNLFKELSNVRNKWSIKELLYEAGLRIVDENSFLKACVDNKVTLVVPGILDGAFGTNLVIYSRIHGLNIDFIKDEEELLNIIFESKKLGALIIGGGISKHHAIWISQFRDGLDYAIYLTTAVEYDGSLSGAHPREAITWGKVKPLAKQVVVYGDATVTLPLIVLGLECLRRNRVKLD